MNSFTFSLVYVDMKYQTMQLIHFTEYPCFTSNTQQVIIVYR